MSLINDALKKAQKHRTDGTPPLSSMPSIGGQSASRIAGRNKSPEFNTLMWWIGGGCLAITILLLGGFFLLRNPSNQPETAPLPKLAAVAANAIPSTPTEPSAAAPVVANAAPSVALANAPLPASAKIETTAAPVAPPPEPVVPKEVVPAPKLPAPKVAYIEALRVAGIRASATDSKVLMNDRVYRLGNIVEHEMALKLVGITATSLTFEDDSGARYTRNF